MKSIIVSPLGSDTSDGSELTPLLTVNRALAASVAGDTIVIRGDITGQTVTVGKGGTAEAPLSIIQHADGGAIDGGFVWPRLPPKMVPMVAPDKTISHYAPLINITASHVQWSVDVRNSLGRGIGVTGDDVTLQDCWIDYCRNACWNTQECKNFTMRRVRWSHGGSYYQTPRASTPTTNWPVCGHLLRVTNATIEDSEGFENWGEGLAVGRGCSVIMARRNKLYDNLSVNLYLDRANLTDVLSNHIYCTGKTPPCEGISLRNETYAGDQTPPLSAVSVTRNLIDGCSKAIVLGRSETAGQLMANVRVDSNTVADSTIVNLFINAADHRAFVVEENIFYQFIGEQAQVSGIRQGEYLFRRNGWVGVQPSAAVRSASDIPGIVLDVNYAPLADYGIGAIDYVAPPPPPPIDPPLPVPDEVVRIVLETNMTPALAAEFRKLLAGRKYTATFQ